MSVFLRKFVNSASYLALIASVYGFMPTDVANAQTSGDAFRPTLDVGSQLLAPDINTSPSDGSTSILPVGNGSNTQPLLAQPSVQPSLGKQNLRATSVGPSQLISVSGELRPLANRRTEPSQGAGGRFEDAPFSPNGLRFGNFLLFPVLEQSLGFTTNADQVANGNRSGFSQTEGRLTLQSDWSVHQLRGEVGASTVHYFSGNTEALNAADAQAEFRLDIQRGWVARFGANYELTSESAASESIDLAPGQVVLDRPAVQTYGGFAALERTAGRLGGSLRTTLQRSDFGSVSLADGSSASQDDRNQSELRAALRLSYELSPAVIPFVQVSYGRRFFDQSVDSDGTDRDASLFDLQVGAAVDLSTKLRGELAFGYGLEDYKDGSLSNLDAITFNGSLAWSPEQLTTITASAQTQLNGANGLDDLGSVTYAAALEVDRRVRSNLSLNGRLNAAWRDFESGREDTTLQAELGATWYFNRTWALIGRLGYERVDSTDAASTYDAATARLGLRFQR